MILLFFLDITSPPLCRFIFYKIIISSLFYFVNFFSTIFLNFLYF
uniref:Uncharacterized protein n=1 Tax=Siphoviridae sp. ctxYv12 TaxID=2827974 RepID=A0A8S5S4X5_9CAUD|nr:MAG TPA: hypothetical protein [Siphoviridae sp. ctxYv12]